MQPTDRANARADGKIRGRRRIRPGIGAIRRGGFHLLSNIRAASGLPLIADLRRKDRHF
jgi:hypothetical protein